MTSIQGIEVSQPTMPSFVVTPGPDVPGAYPAGGEDVAQNSGSVFNTAKQYVPGQEDVRNALVNASQTAKQYLPRGIASYFPGTNESNTTIQAEKEDKQVEPISAPVKAVEDVTNSATRSDISTPQDSISDFSTIAQDGSIAGGTTPSREAQTPLQTPIIVSEQSSVPPVESPAKIPQEITPTPTIQTNPRIHAFSGEETPDIESVHSSDMQPLVPNNDSAARESTIAQLGHETPSSSISNPADNGSRFQGIDTPSSAVSNHKRIGSEGVNSVNSNTSPRKSRFLDKVKGEAKVLSGKLSRNEEKVEEGRKMLGKV